MCLPDFIEYKQIDESSPLIGYRLWRLNINNPINLMSEHQNYNWNKTIEGPHEVTDSNSGIYAYNNNNNNYYNNNNYSIFGIIKQYGKVAIHKTGQRSEYAKIDILFSIRELDAKGAEKFLDWIKEFNLIITNLSKEYECKTIHWQDFNDRNKS